jgi:predicted TIM-barrel fold metal-dependent hydrolase
MFALAMPVATFTCTSSRTRNSTRSRGRSSRRARRSRRLRQIERSPEARRVEPTSRRPPDQLRRPEQIFTPSERVNACSAIARHPADRLIAVGSVSALLRTATGIAAINLGIRRSSFIRRISLRPNAYLAGNTVSQNTAAEEANVPVMIHTGTSIFPSARNRFADPMPVDDVAVDFPKLAIILAHSGRPLYGETAFFLARRHANVHLELSGIPPKKILQQLPRLAEVADKTLWGTDWPSPGIRSPSENVAAFRSLPLTEEAKEKILFGNAKALFGG